MLEWHPCLPRSAGNVPVLPLNVSIGGDRAFDVLEQPTMNKLCRSILIPAAVLAFSGAAYAETQTCNGTLADISIDGDVLVPARQSCTLNGTGVKGDVKVGRGANLQAFGAIVDGDIQADKAGAVTVERARVDGDIQVKESDAIRVADTWIDGDLQLFDNNAGASVNGNRIGGNLQCKGNKGRIGGSDNQVKGNKQDQCRRL